ncbi:septum formation family protein [Ornithinimicrobium sp. Arc0846-15]|nr:septum formation family protein [Ornithinimicrobium laminariae]
MKIRQTAALSLAAAAALALSACSTSAPTAEIGDCMDYAGLTGEVSELPTLDCTEAHDAQVIHKFDLPDGDFPTEDEYVAALEAECLPAFESFVGVSYEESSLFISDLSPQEEGWDAGDRETICIAYTEDADVTESFEGSNL